MFFEGVGPEQYHRKRIMRSRFSGSEASTKSVTSRLSLSPECLEAHQRLRSLSRVVSISPVSCLLLVPAPEVLLASWIKYPLGSDGQRCTSRPCGLESGWLF